MKIYLDLYFIFNVIMDMIIITSVSILLRRKTNYFKIILSSLIGGISSLLLFSNINSILLQIISIIFMSITSYGYKSIRYTTRNIIYVYILSVLLGGIIYLFNIRVSDNILLSYLIIIIISIEVMILYIKENKKMKNTYNNYYRVDIYFRDKDKLYNTS